MKKLLDLRYWIIGATVVITAIFFVAYKQHDAAEKYKRHRTEYCASLMAPAEQKKACVEEGANARDYLPWGYELFRWPEGITTWAIIFTGFAIAWQSWETRKAADASSKAAEAARLSAQSAVNIERPWIVVTAESYGRWRFKFYAANRGNSPAEIVSIASDWLIADGFEYRDRPPKYNLRKAANPRLIFPGDKPYGCGACNIGDLLQSNGEGLAVASGEKLFMMYGKVLYYDLLNRQDPPHETRFCFYWSSGQPDQVDDRDGPDTYAGYT